MITFRAGPQGFARSVGLAVLLALGLSSLPARAEVGYRWTDSAGTVHISDRAPEGIDAERIELPKAPTVAPVTEPDPAPTSGSDTQETRGGIGGVISGSVPSNSESECDRKWREYFESQECFAPYQRVGAGPREEAYEKCTEVPSPAVECGPARNFPKEGQ